MICPLSGRYTALGFSLAFSLFILHPASRVEAAPLGKKPALPLRVNCGGGTIKDPETGALWLSDKDYVVRGKKYRFPQDLKIAPNADNPPKSVYSTVRRASVIYRFKKLPNGIYKVRLFFVDGKQLAVRSMDFWIEGAHLVQNLNIREAAGGVNRGYVYEAVVEVKDGNGLDIRGTRGHGDDVFISAIEIQNAPVGAALTRSVEASPAPPPDLAQQLRDFADGPVKVVWARTDEEEDFYLKGNHGTLMGFDSEDGKGERVILGELRSYATPMITPDGRQIIFTDQVKHKCYVVNFDGTGLREIVEGYASDVWTDPKTQITWVYVRTGWRDTKAPVRRYQLDKPNVSELVWKQSGTGQPQTAWFHVSGDGKLAADAFPWPQCGLADLGGTGFQVMGKGCWPAVAPDSSHRYFYFIGQHTAVQFYDTPQSPARTVNLATVPGWTGRKVYHPRWSNDVRFITLTAPQWMPETELYIGRFNPEYTQIESWFRVTYNQTADFYGDAWFASAAQHNQAPGSVDPALASLPAPKVSQSSAGLAFVWENERSRNAITDDTGAVVRTWTAKYEGQTRPNRWNGARIRNGSLTPDEDAGRVVGQKWHKSEAATLMLDMTTDRKSEAGEASVAGMYDADGNPLMVIQQDGAHLEAQVRTQDGATAKVPLGEVQNGVPTQVAISIQSSTIAAYRDGKALTKQPSNLHMGSWKPSSLIFGNDERRRSPWEGDLENLRIYDRALEDREISALHEKSSSSWRTRTPAPKVIVEAELLQASEPDEPETIAPYVRSLGENVYRVKKVLSGELPDKDIIVLQWVVLGGTPLPSAERHEGTLYKLELEPADQHPELAGEHRSTDIFEPVLNVYYDVGL